MAKTDKPLPPIPPHVPAHLRKKIRPKATPSYFEVDPPCGSLLPGQWMDIRVRFMPAEEVSTHSIN